jgi:hypothetical protein
MTKTVIDVLAFDDCPNAQRALGLVARVVGELALDADVRQIDVPDVGAAFAHRFLGSLAAV